jgi:UDP-3-O-[3-hydroxymyristoyl] glucosamine N-acyltransferase
MIELITNADLTAATGEDSLPEFSADGLDLASGRSVERVLTFLDDAAFVEAALANDHLAAILCTAELLEPLKGFRGTLVTVDDPRWSYFTLHNALAADRQDTWPSRISPSAQIHPTAHIDAVGVEVGDDVVIDANATVLASSRLLRGAVIRPGAVIGVTGFEHKRTSHGILSVVHDGTVTIGERTEVSALASVARGYARRPTIIGADCRLDFGVMVAHGGQLGDRVFMAAGAVTAGMVTVGDDAWIGPGAVVRDQLTIGRSARVSIGSVVLRDVPDDQVVVGNPARAIHG